MKKIALLLSAMALTAGAFAAEKGDMAAGVNLNVVPCLESGVDITNFGIGAKFQYNVTDPIRLEAALNYDFKNKGVSVFEFGVNAHYLFNVTDKLQVYPLVGLGYGNIKGVYSIDADFEYDDDYSNYRSRAYDDDFDFDYDDEDFEDIEDIDVSSSLNRFYFNVGAGAEYKITSNLSAGLEIKYQYMKDFSRLPISLGVTYSF